MANEKKVEPAKAKIEKTAEQKTQAALEEAAMQRVCKTMGLDYQAIIDKEVEDAKPKEMFHYDLGGTEIRVNGSVIANSGICDGGTLETYMELVGTKRMRLLREKVGTDYELHQLVPGSFSARVVKKIGLGGEVVR